ncbi:Ankyrin-2 [Dactylella cylindrospora]|nr:Ankyrin-2 [Dactylella cylindrospora]
MFEAITGCIFFGTPFEGAQVAMVASMCAQFSERFGLDLATSSKLLDLMKPGDEGLRELKNEFMRLATKTSPKIELFCFWEEKPTNWSKQAGLPFRVPIPKSYEDFVTRESATLTGVDSAGLGRTHRELVKFDSFKDPVYQIVRGRLKAIINSAPLIARNRFNSTRGIDREVVKGVLDALEGVQVEKKRKRLSQGVISSSWILQEEEYTQWLDKGDRMLDCLWILGPEGKGKLGACLAAIDKVEEVVKAAEAKNQGEAATMFAYFFCDSTSEGSSPDELLKSLLRQLVNQQEGLAPYAKHFSKPQKGQESRNKNQAALTVENLWQSLQDTLTDDIVGTVYFIINNLHSMDEEADPTKKLMEFISSSLDFSDNENSSGPRIRWLFTSQNRHSIKQALKAPEIRVIDLDDDKYGDQVQQELRLHAQRKIATLGLEKGYNKALTYFAGSLIGKRAQNTQWIDMTIIQLSELPVDARDLKVRSLLERMPQDLKTLLDRAWQSVLDSKDDQVEEIKEMLRTLIITYEDPTEDELAVLTGLSFAAEQRAHLCGLVEKCRPLLMFRKTGKSDRITFMNSVVKAHLNENAERLLGVSPEEIRWQHGILALRNFTHLMERFSDPEDANAKDDSETAKGETNISDEKNPQGNVPNEGGTDETNAVKAGETSNQGTDDAPVILSATMANPAQELEFMYSEDEDEDEDEEEYSDEEPTHTTEHVEDNFQVDVSIYAVKHWLHHASKATSDIAETLSQEKEFWKRDSKVRNRWLKVYASHSSSFEGITFENLTGLHVAASIGFAQLVSALLKNGHEDERDIRDPQLSNTPLHLAAWFGRPNITEVLLNHGAKIDDGQEEGDSTPLAMAACNGHCKVMMKLLNRKANPNALGQGGPVINSAIVSGNMEAVRLLVEHGALLTHEDNPDIEDDLPPLSLSALLSDLAMFTYLLEACADKIPDAEYSKALIFSAVAGRIEVTRRLLAFKHPLETFQEALEEAVDEENWDIVLLILESCEGLNCDEAFSDIAISSDEQDRILSAMWKHTKGGISQETLSNSLYQAVDKEKESTVKVLLEEFSADANAKGEEFGNALTAAAYDGTIEIVKMLLEHGADINSPDGWALQSAASQGHFEVVEYLLEKGADVNGCADTEKFSPGTALQAAVEAGQEKIVALLLEHKADPDVGAGPLTCPIIAACRYGEAASLDLLLDAGAKVQVFGGPDKSSPLNNAAMTLHEASVKRILDAGADINLEDNDGDTAIIVAATVGDATLVNFLLKNGADVMHISKRNENALQAAFKSGSQPCIQLLIEAISLVIAGLNIGISRGSQDIIRVVRNIDYSALKLPREPGEEDEPATEGEDTAPEEDAGETANERSDSKTETTLTQEPELPIPVSEEHAQNALESDDTTLPTVAPLSITPATQRPPEYKTSAFGYPRADEFEQAPGIYQDYESYSRRQSMAISQAPTNVDTAPASQATPPPQCSAPPRVATVPQESLAYQISSVTQNYQNSPISQTPQEGHPQEYQANQSYQRPSRKPLNPDAPRPLSYSSKPGTPDYQGSTNYQGSPTAYPNYQAPTPNQGHPGAQGGQTYPSPPPSQGYPTPQSYSSPQPGQGYHASQPSQSYPNPQPIQGYANPPPGQPYPNQQPTHGYPGAQPNQGYGYQSPPPGQGYQRPPPNQGPQDPNQQYPNTQQNPPYRASGYFPNTNSQPTQGSKYRYDGSW